MFLDIIISWYSELSCRVKWGESFSEWFSVTAGVRQGGVLSPDLYCIYVDELLTLLKKLNKGCYFLGHFAAAYFYADGICVISKARFTLCKALGPSQPRGPLLAIFA